MKKVMIILALLLSSAMAYSQTPTTAKNENIKGNVFSVRYLIYGYSENFGSPTEGELRWVEDMVFDAQGRAILFKVDSKPTCCYLVRYKKEGNNTIAELSTLLNGMDYYDTFNDFLNKDKINDNFFREITYNSDNIVTKYDVFQKSYSISKYKLTRRKLAKPIGNGAYECKLYKKDGSTALDFKETYNSKGQLTMLDNNAEYNNLFSSFDRSIKISHAGTYQYNAAGQLVSYKQQKNNAPTTFEYVYNEQGDLIEEYAFEISKNGEATKKRLRTAYEDYKYDDKGNWIYRTRSSGKEKYLIEKRKIEYCNSARELESKTNEIYSKFQLADMKAAEEFSVLYEKYLAHARYIGQIPLIEYDSKYASVKNADKAFVVIYADFKDPNCNGELLLNLSVPSKYYSKLITVAKEIKGKKEYKYVYRNGKLIMNNDEYVIDTSTGELKNITKNITFTKE